MGKYTLFLAAVVLLSFSSTTFAQSDLIPGDTLALPIFFFHGVTANPSAGANLEANFTAEGRLFTPLSFGSDACSVQALNLQILLAIAQTRSIVVNASRCDNGYVFVSHSQGGAIARGVIEEMDDHNVKVFVSLAGAANSGFNGPQPEDALPFRVFVTVLGPQLLPPSLLDFFKYTIADYFGKLQREFTDLAANTPSLQDQYSVFNLGRSPYYDQWVKTNPYFPVINNLKVCDAGDVKCEDDKKRRRDNFLKLKEAHFFASPADEFIAPWQQSHLAYYNEVSSAEEIETKFSSFKVLDVTQTREYTNDTYGLRTLDKRGGLFFHTAQGVGHNCWTRDYIPTGQNSTCYFQPVFNQHVYPVLRGSAFFHTRASC